MARSIFFQNNNWPASPTTIFYVFEFLASRLPEGPTRDRLTELVDENLPFLDVKDPEKSQLVDLLAEELPGHIDHVEDPRLRDNLTIALSDLIEFARRQQAINRAGQ